MAGRKVDLLSKLAIAGAQLGVIDITMATAAVIHWMLIDPLLPRATRPSYVLVSLLAVGGMLVVVI
ncbi:MAG: hypothetical protein H7232_08085 [Aeromicrobium sp.]|nr:hypothetical protein [Burkholderiales bacterium]